MERLVLRGLLVIQGTQASQEAQAKRALRDNRALEEPQGPTELRVLTAKGVNLEVQGSRVPQAPLGPLAR